MRLMKAAGREVGATAQPEWGDPGFFGGRSRLRDALRLLWQLIRPPKGHRTMPTKTGMLLILLAIGIGSAGFNTGHNILYLMLAVLLSALLVSGILSWQNFRGCRWRLVCGERMRAGEANPVHLEIRNQKKWLPSYSLTFLVASERSGELAAVALEGRLDAGEQRRLRWIVEPERRGRDRIRLRGLVSRYPFGFLKKTIEDSVSREVVVWPERLAVDLDSARAGRPRPHGAYFQRGEGVELLGLREYRRGDAPRAVHWKATARMGKLQVRETAQEANRSFRIWVETAVKRWEKEADFERMCRAAGSLAELLYQREQLRSLQVDGEAAIVVACPADLERVLDRLAVVARGDAGEAGEGHGVAGAIRFRATAAGRIELFSEEGILGEA